MLNVEDFSHGIQYQQQKRFQLDASMEQHDRIPTNNSPSQMRKVTQSDRPNMKEFILWGKEGQANGAMMSPKQLQK